MDTALGWLDVVPMGDLALLMHGLMMPVMLVPMLVRPGLYAGHMHHAHARGRAPHTAIPGNG